MLSKFETIGIFSSIAIMALVLFVLKADDENLAQVPVSGVSQSAVAVVAGDTDQDVYNALVDSVDHEGQVQKLVIDDVVVGSGDEVKAGDVVEVHYIGTLQNGQQFDNSRAKGQSFTFEIGAGRVIDGWEEGVKGMKVGGQRILVVPPEMGYGDRNIGPIPANSTLIFAIELLSIN